MTREVGFLLLNGILLLNVSKANSNHQNEDLHQSTNRHRFHNKRTFVGFARISNIWRQMPIRESSNLDSPVFPLTDQTTFDALSLTMTSNSADSPTKMLFVIGSDWNGESSTATLQYVLSPDLTNSHWYRPASSLVTFLIWRIWMHPSSIRS